MYAEPLLSQKARRRLGFAATFAFQVALMAGVHALLYAIFGREGDANTPAAHGFWGLWMATTLRVFDAAGRRLRARRERRALERQGQTQSERSA